MGAILACGKRPDLLSEAEKKYRKSEFAILKKVDHTHIGGITSLLFLEESKEKPFKLTENASDDIETPPFITAGCDGRILYWNPKTFLSERHFFGHVRKVNVLLHLDNGKFASASDDKTIRIWDIETGVCEKKLIGHTKPITTLVYDTLKIDGLISKKVLISGSHDSKIKVWDLETKSDQDSCLMTIEEPDLQHLCQVIVVINEEEIACSSNENINIYNVNEGGKLVKTLKGGYQNVVFHMIVVQRKFLVSSNGKVIRIWDLENTDKFNRELSEHVFEIKKIVAYAPGLLLSIDIKGNIKLWDIDEEGKCIKSYDHINLQHDMLTMETLPAQKMIVTGGTDKELIFRNLTGVIDEKVKVNK
jgi:WD40 repeat protein